MQPHFVGLFFSEKPCLIPAGAASTVSGHFIFKTVLFFQLSVLSGSISQHLYQVLSLLNERQKRKSLRRSKGWKSATGGATTG